jgi:ABC-type Na+ efflux pump permease subunit
MGSSENEYMFVSNESMDITMNERGNDILELLLSTQSRNNNPSKKI